MLYTKALKIVFKQELVVQARMRFYPCIILASVVKGLNTGMKITIPILSGWLLLNQDFQSNQLFL